MNEILYTIFLVGINLVFISVGFGLLCVTIGALSEVVTRIRNPIIVSRVTNRETFKCQTCENIGPEYTSSYITETEYSDEDCSICLGSMEMHDIERLRCKHMYHRKCLSIWMDLKNQCPTCRSKGCCVRIPVS